MADPVTAAMVNGFLGAKVDSVASDVGDIDTAVDIIFDATLKTKLTLTASEDITTGDLISLTADGEAKKYVSGDLLLGTASTSNTATNPVDVVLVNSRRGILLNASPVNKNSLQDFSYSSETYDFSAQSTNVGSLFIGDSGTKMYLGKKDFTGGRRIYQYTLSTPWDISSASYASKNFNTDSQVGGELVGIFFKPDGTKLFAQSGNGEIYSYTLSTPWDVSTTTYDSVFKSLSGAGDTYSMTFSSDGTALYITDNDDNELKYYTLSTPWDVSTIALASSLSVSSQTATPSGVSISDDGHFLFVIDSTGTDRLLHYYLPTAYDLSTAYYTGRSFDLSNEGSTPWGLFVRPGGVEFIVQNAGDLYKYSHADFVPGDRLSINKYGLYTKNVHSGEYVGYKLSDTQILQDSSTDLLIKATSNVGRTYKNTSTAALSDSSDTTLIDITGSGSLNKLVFYHTDPSNANTNSNLRTDVNTLKITVDGVETTYNGSIAAIRNFVNGGNNASADGQWSEFSLNIPYSESIKVTARRSNTTYGITGTAYYYEDQ